MPTSAVVVEGVVGRFAGVVVNVVGVVFVIAVVSAVAGCPDAPQPTPPPTPITDDGLSAMATSTRGALIWKRNTVLARGLSAALLVPEADLCRELDRFDCTNVAHQVPLGGNDAFVKGQYLPLDAPSATSAVAFDRLVLSACSVAVDFDRERPASFIFRGHDLDDVPLDPEDENVIEGARFVGTELYRRLHAREPREQELVTLLQLLEPDADAGAISGNDFAKLACFAVASTTETLFY
jgi:hypothetical protein